MPHSRATLDTATPLTVKEYLAKRAALREAQHPNGGDDPLDRENNLVHLRAMPAALFAERVRLSIRGRKFEMAMDVATSYSLSLHYFFSTVLRVAEEPAPTSPRAPAAAGGGAGKALEGETVFDLVRRSISAEQTQKWICEWATSSILSDHYKYVMNMLVEDELEAIVREPGRRKDEEGLWDDLPQCFLPETISYDPSARVWLFQFKTRIEADSDGAGDMDPQANPFQLLQPEHVGMLIVYLRKSHELAQRHARTSGGDSTDDKHKHPRFPLRWTELSYDQQLGIVQFVRSLGIVALLSAPHSLHLPSMERSTSSYADYMQHDSDQDTSPATYQSCYEYDENSEREEQEERSRIEGCKYCGMAGHTYKTCPYANK
ncbi:hypothetical protein STCU_08282 [Strigomonas culicis]|uniref:CCHC-type domain-containing protein n=1 Tax=Strigomonas culicis TaxID=28005 RepID=S9U007_9TRYP|nr:hypothetical protein STCU_08282 [Strigomonas culicis]|eukprot:EPY22243.1 hypothetical protein STCU_08282 [Strigomonas culicis]